MVRILRPEKLTTKIFLDSGDPAETKKSKEILGFLDGQTTNPTLIPKNPKIQERIAKKDYLSRDEIYEEYKKIARKISSTIPNGSISIEVYADQTTTEEDMLAQARKMFSWIPGAHIKFPILPEGLKAAKRAVEEGIRVNMTLCFTQEQAAAVYEATMETKEKVYVSPFVGRLDDIG